MFKGFFGKKSPKDSNSKSSTDRPRGSTGGMHDALSLLSEDPLRVTMHNYISNFSTARLVDYDTLYRAVAIVMAEEFFVCGHNFVTVALPLTDMAASDITQIGFMQGQGLIVALSTYGIRVWNYRKGSIIFSYSSGDYLSLFCPDGNAPHFFVGTKSGLVLVFEMTKRQLCTFRVSLPDYVGRNELRADASPAVKLLTGFPFDPNALLAYSDQCGLVKFYIAERRTSAIFVLPGHTLTSTQTITACTVSAGSKYVFGGTNTGQLLMWTEKGKDKNRKCQPELSINIGAAIGLAGAAIISSLEVTGVPGGKGDTYHILVLHSTGGVVEVTMRPESGQFQVKLLLDIATCNLGRLITLHSIPWRSHQDNTSTNFLGIAAAPARGLYLVYKGDHDVTCTRAMSFRAASDDAHAATVAATCMSCFDPDVMFLRPYTTKKARWPDFGGGDSAFADRGFFGASPTMITCLDSTNTLRLAKWLPAKSECLSVPTFLLEDVKCYAVLWNGAMIVTMTPQSELRITDMFTFETVPVPMSEGVPRAEPIQIVAVDTMPGGPYIAALYASGEVCVFALGSGARIGYSAQTVVAITAALVGESEAQQKFYLYCLDRMGQLIAMTLPNLQPMRDTVRELFSCGDAHLSPARCRVVALTARAVQQQQFEKRSSSQLRALPINCTVPYCPLSLPEKLGVRVCLHLWSFKLNDAFILQIESGRGTLLLNVSVLMDPTGLLVSMTHSNVSPAPSPKCIVLPTDVPETMWLLFTHDLIDYFIAAQYVIGANPEEGDRQPLIAESYDTEIHEDNGHWRHGRTRGMLANIRMKGHCDNLANVVRKLVIVDDDDLTDDNVVCEGVWVATTEQEECLENSHVEPVSHPYASHLVAAVDGLGVLCVDLRSMKVTGRAPCGPKVRGLEPVCTEKGWGAVMLSDAGLQVLSTPDLAVMTTYQFVLSASSAFTIRSVLGITQVTLVGPEGLDMISLETTKEQPRVVRMVGYNTGREPILPFTKDCPMPAQPSQHSPWANAEQSLVKALFTGPNYDGAMQKLGQIFASGEKGQTLIEPSLPVPLPSQALSTRSAEEKRKDLMTTSGSSPPQEGTEVQRKVNKTQRGVAETKELMSENLQLLNERGEAIKRMQDKSADMSKEAENFHSNIQKLLEREKNKKWWQL